MAFITFIVFNVVQIYTTNLVFSYFFVIYLSVTINLGLTDSELAGFYCNRNGILYSYLDMRLHICYKHSCKIKHVMIKYYDIKYILTILIEDYNLVILLRLHIVVKLNML